MLFSGYNTLQITKKVHKLISEIKIRHYLRPAIEMLSKLVILCDLNIQVGCDSSLFDDFMETSFGRKLQIKQSTFDSESVLDLIFANCRSFCAVIVAYWSDYKLKYTEF